MCLRFVHVSDSCEARANLAHVVGTDVFGEAGLEAAVGPTDETPIVS